MNLHRELEAALSLGREAADLVLRMRRQGVEVEHKAGDEPVTAADRAASDLIMSRLARLFPGDALLSEEAPDTAERLTSDRVWMIDPIDGTRDFIRNESGYAVMIGLCIAGRPALGVVTHPPTGTSFVGATGVGAWKEGPDGARTALVTTSIAQPPGIRLVASKSNRTGDIDRFRKALRIEDEENTGGVGLKVGLVADASRDLYVYPGTRTKIWDSCAPEAILTAAGGRVTDTYGAPLTYDLPDVHNRRGIVASNGPLHDLVLSTLARLRATPEGL